MGAEVSQQIPQQGVNQDVSGNVYRDDRMCSSSEDESQAVILSQHLKLADWEKAGIRIHDPNSTTRNQMSNMHFSDYSLYPDRFAQTENPQSGRRGSLSSDPSSSISPSPSNLQPPQNTISKYNFKIRTNSVSESNPEPPEPMPGSNRPRSSSYSSSKLYYFDFSLIPDKDPNCTFDEQQRTSDVKTRRRLYSAGDLENPPSGGNGVTNPSHPATGPPVIKVTEQPTIKEEDERVKPPKANTVPPRKRKTSAPPRFCFFDYSMIPDKDPRWTQKPNRDIEVKKV